jgi:hypothetical protein
MKKVICSSLSIIVCNAVLEKNCDLRAEFWCAIESGRVQEVEVFLQTGIDTSR